MENIANILNTFTPISLKEMDDVKLLDRMDTKFTFRLADLPELLIKISPKYSVLDVNNVRINRYETLYFDTNKLNLYNQHHNGKLNRYKIRYRRYTDSNLNFFEIKFRNNRNRTIKKRISENSINSEIINEAKKFLIKQTCLDPKDLSAKLWVYYSRITLVNKSSKERLTIDLNLNYKNGDNAVSFPNLVIAEVKQEKACNSCFTQIMKEKHIRNISISKYCLGIINLYENIKTNNFKPKLTLIKKLCYE